MNLGPFLDIRQTDCMDLMREFPDQHFDLAIVDPPYGIGECGATNATRTNLAVAKAYKAFSGNDETAPPAEYFAELRRVSRHQIIWGANHFLTRLSVEIDSPCWVVWDKLNGENDFADCELAWTSFKTAVRRFSFRWAGMLQGNMRDKEDRIHPTQKPVALYSWLLSRYAKPGQRILDTHLGSGSHAIACHHFGAHLSACEIDADYYAGAVKRIEKELRQPTFAFPPAPVRHETADMFARP